MPPCETKNLYGAFSLLVDLLYAVLAVSDNKLLPRPPQSPNHGILKLGLIFACGPVHAMQNQSPIKLIGMQQQ
jgi:hypothetical protein